MANPNTHLAERPHRQCTAHSERTGLPCRRYAIKGGTVCHFHGGAAPQVREKANQRLREMVDPMISRLHDLAMQTDNLKVASECVRDALDRAGIGDLVQAKIRQSHRESTGAGITVNLGYIALSGPASPVPLSLPDLTITPLIRTTE